MPTSRTAPGNRSRAIFLAMLVAAIAGRLTILLLLRTHWGWQSPYHVVYFQRPVWFEPSVNEYLMWQMPGYWAFLRLLQLLPWNLYVAAPAIQTAFQILAIAWLTYRLAVLAPQRLRAAAVLAAVLGIDPWLCDTAISMLPASLTASIFIVLVERTIEFCDRAIEGTNPPSPVLVVSTAGVLGAIGTYLRADFATYAALPAAGIALLTWLSGGRPWRSAVTYGLAGAFASGLLVVALLLPRAAYLRVHTGSFTLTTNAGGGGLWFGLGEVANPWNIPNPESGDEPIEEFARAHGHPFAYASKQSSAFFASLFLADIREHPTALLKVIVARLHRVMLGWPPSAVSFAHDYEMAPEIGRLGEQLRHQPWYRLLWTWEYGPWIVKQLGLRYLGTALLWLLPLTALWYVARRTTPALIIPILAYAVGTGVFILVHWSSRYGQQFYWLGWLGLYLLGETARRAAGHQIR